LLAPENSGCSLWLTPSQLQRQKSPVPASRLRRERRRRIESPDAQPLTLCAKPAGQRHDTRPRTHFLSQPLRNPEAERGDAVSCSEAAAS
jgi:hypothetical protein